jgi:hypothetical protein
MLTRQASAKAVVTVHLFFGPFQKKRVKQKCTTMRRGCFFAPNFEAPKTLNVFAYFNDSERHTCMFVSTTATTLASANDFEEVVILQELQVEMRKRQKLFGTKCGRYRIDASSGEKGTATLPLTWPGRLGLALPVESAPKDL